MRHYRERIRTALMVIGLLAIVAAPLAADHLSAYAFPAIHPETGSQVRFGPPPHDRITIGDGTVQPAGFRPTQMRKAPQCGA